MMTRQYLKKSVRLSGTGDQGTFIRTFEVRKVLSEGASSICYEASYKDSAAGVLKEFYPWNAYVLERDEDGQLVRSEEFHDADEWFRKAVQEYLEPYQMLLDVKKHSTDQDLATFIPAFEIYYGCDEKGRRNGTVYMWTPRPRVETFDKICEEIHEHPGKNPEHKLIQILYAIESLAKRVCALHCADLLHRDINPSNFGFEKLRDETLTQTLQMFDINSICSVFGKMEQTVGTKGYMEPESGYEIPTNQTDLYSIGATLFYAIVICEETRKNGFLYQSSYYGRLGELVGESELLRASETNAHPRLRNILTTILRKCLCERTYRYANCEELIEDLDQAICFALPSDLAKKHIPGARWVLADLEESLDKNKEKNSRLAIQYHLYEKPLYQCMKEEDASLNVLAIGFGNYGQKFLDACLPNGQLLGKPLLATVVSDDSAGEEFTRRKHHGKQLSDRELYLSERPELSDFFEIEGAFGDEKTQGKNSGESGGTGARLCGKSRADSGEEACVNMDGASPDEGTLKKFRTEDMYGKIRFETRKLNCGSRRENVSVIRTIIEEGRPHYIFVALGEDELNLQTALACREALDTLGMEGLVSYVCEAAVSMQRHGTDIQKQDAKMQERGSDIQNRVICKQEQNAGMQKKGVDGQRTEAGEVAAGRQRTEAGEVAAGRQRTEAGEVAADGQEPAPDLYPVYVSADAKKSGQSAEIERMALNAHLVWKKERNIAFRDIRKEFKKPYNHDACISTVLSIKYKLHWLGIDLAALGPEEAARRFAQSGCGTAKKNADLKNKLVCMEHRRWVAEKLCLGWRRITDLTECLSGPTRDERHKRHVCIVRSRPDQKLSSDFGSSSNFSKWDTATEEELDGLDELDRMSVELHRMYEKNAQIAKRHNLLGGNTIMEIKSLAGEDKKVAAAFWEWYVCLENLWRGEKNRERANQYEGLKLPLLEASEQSDILTATEKKTLAAQVRAFDAMFRPVLESARYRDWKQDDVALTEQIPFILTWSETITMIIPYETGENKEFNNVASASAALPKRILYLYSARKGQDLRSLYDSVPYVVNYMEKKNFRASVDFLLLCERAAVITGGSQRGEDSAADDIAQKLKRLGKGRIRKVKVFIAAKAEEAYPALEKYLGKKLRAKEADAAEKTVCANIFNEKAKYIFAEKNETKLSYLLEGKGFYEMLPNYRFDSSTIKFHSVAGCSMLSYIRRAPAISVSDMAALKLSRGAPGRIPEFIMDYKELWKKYCGNTSLWKAMCDALGSYTQKNDCLAVFRKKSEEEKDDISLPYFYLVPFACRPGCEKVLKALKEQGIAEKDSCVSEYSAESCRITIVDRCGYKTEFDRLFSNVYALMLPDEVETSLNMKNRELRIQFDNLIVTDAQMPVNKGTANQGGVPDKPAGTRYAQSRALLTWFSERGYLINLRTTADGKAGFTFATRQVKELLTKAGKMLEIYTYHKIREFGFFDDVVGSYELDWEGTEIRNEFDCIATKGFRSLFIECKARNELEQDFYFKLSTLARKFGINATAVLVADTQEKDTDENARINAMQRKRGEMLGVVTIWKPEEISNIGHTLMKVINGTHLAEEEDGLR